jgi:site-specific recombinase XerD
MRILDTKIGYRFQITGYQFFKLKCVMNRVQIRVVFDRKKTASTRKRGLVQIEVRFENKRKFVSTGIKLYKNQFKTGRIVNIDDADRLNERITNQIKEINDLVDKLDQNKQKFSLDYIDHINDIYIGGSFIEFMEKRISERPTRITTQKQHRKVLNFLKNECTLLTYFSDLTYQNITRLDEYLKKRKVDGRPMMQTTIHTYHKVIKVYINEAIKFEMIQDNPYRKFQDCLGTPRERTVLNLQEIDLIRKYKTLSALERKSRDLFIVQCYTGLSYSDLMSVDFTKAERYGDDYILKDERLKTGVSFFAALLPPVVDILDKYNYQLPHLAYDVYNRTLKLVAASAGVKKHISTHIGRHTFATTIALGSGLPIEVVAKMLGHRNIRTTQIYAKIMPKAVLEGFQKIKGAI